MWKENVFALPGGGHTRGRGVFRGGSLVRVRCPLSPEFEFKKKGVERGKKARIDFYLYFQFFTFFKQGGGAWIKISIFLIFIGQNINSFAPCLNIPPLTPSAHP